VVNLAVNARDAMPDGGRLTIDTRPATFYGKDPLLPPALPPGNYIRMEVSDTGIGMDANTRSHLFEPFFTTKERGRGTGLGLSTSYGIVKQNQGEILVYSEVGIGSVFKIFLPAVEQSLEVQHPISTHRERIRGTETVLVVEDEDGVRQVVVQMLQQEGYHVLTAQSGADALRLCDRVSEPIHLLITDVIMPKMSGRELALKLAPVLPDMKVLFVSGYTDSTIAQHGVLDPGMNFLQKPFTPELLADKVRQVLGANGASSG
jgi:CheY-like chemotaxis protein